MQPFDLRGNGIVLSPPTVEDIDRITQLCQDPELQRWLSTLPVPYRRENAEQFVTDLVPSGWETGQDLTWAIRDPEDRRVRGVISLRPSTAAAIGDIGFWVSAKDRGQHVASRAIRLLAEYAFDSEGLGLTHLSWHALVGNWASRRVAWACGFKFEGTLHGHLSQRGEPRDAWAATLAAGEKMAPASQWLDIPRIHGERVILRPFVDSDASSVAAACQDPQTQHWLGQLPSPYTQESAHEFFGHCAELAASGDGVCWAAALLDDSPAVGSFSITRLKQDHGGGEVGYWLHPNARGQGVAVEAVRLIARHAFTPIEEHGLGLRRLKVRHAEGNTASQRVIERAGFQPFGVERAAENLRSGVIVDFHWYDMLAEDSPNTVPR